MAAGVRGVTGCSRRGRGSRRWCTKSVGTPVHGCCEGQTAECLQEDLLRRCCEIPVSSRERPAGPSKVRSCARGEPCRGLAQGSGSGVGACGWVLGNVGMELFECDGGCSCQVVAAHQGPRGSAVQASAAGLARSLAAPCSKGAYNQLFGCDRMGCGGPCWRPVGARLRG